LAHGGSELEGEPLQLRDPGDLRVFSSYFHGG
jgi:hypothetical protein